MIKVNTRLFMLLFVLIFPIFQIQNVKNNYQTLDLEEEKASIPNYEENKIKQEENVVSYVHHSSIEIKSDNDFGNFSSSGIGTHYDPFIIENYNITTSNDTGILIQNTTKHFIIKNCLIKAYKHGITINYVASGTTRIENNVCSYHIFNGINIRESSGSMIINNTAHHNSHMGITVIDSGSWIISENNCYKNSWGGIYIDDGYNSEITNNEIIENYYYGGLSIYGSFNIIVRNNTFTNNAISAIKCYESDGIWIEFNHISSNNDGGGISLSHCTTFSVQNNTINTDRNGIGIYRSFDIMARCNYLYNTGLYIHQDNITDYYYLEIEDNYVNNKKLGFFFGKDQIKIKESTYGQLIFIDCTDVEVENQGKDRGFLGITVKSCDSVVIKNSRTLNLEEDGNWGLRVIDSEAVEVLNCIFSYGRGISFENTMNSKIKSNTCSNNYYGIYLEYSRYCDLINNTCFNNTRYGMNLYRIDYCEITYNKIYKNGFTDWEDFGLEISGNFNILHHNAFYMNNFNGTINVIDYGDNNTWFDEKTLEGNYYDDWSGIGTYQIPGPANSTDPYPLSEIPVYTEPNHFAIYFSLILYTPIVALTLFRIFSKRKFIQ